MLACWTVLPIKLALVVVFFWFIGLSILLVRRFVGVLALAVFVKISHLPQVLSRFADPPVTIEQRLVDVGNVHTPSEGGAHPSEIYRLGRAVAKRGKSMVATIEVFEKSLLAGGPGAVLTQEQTGTKSLQSVRGSFSARVPRSSFAEVRRVLVPHMEESGEEQENEKEDEREDGKQRAEGRVVESKATHNIMSA